MTEIALVLTSLGFGGLLGVYGKALLDRRHLRFSKAFEYKERRYQAMAILMWVAMNPSEPELSNLASRRPELSSADAVDRELDLEYYNAMMFASSHVLRELKAFLTEKSLTNWERTMRAIKRDLYM